MFVTRPIGSNIALRSLRTSIFQILLIVADIVLRIISLRGEDQGDSSRREVVQMAPDAWRHEQPLERSVQADALALVAIIEDHLKATACRDDKLPCLVVCMCSTDIIRK